MASDQSTYFGRVQHFVKLIDPSLLLKTDADLLQAQALIDEFKNKAGSAPPPGSPELKRLWEAQTLLDASVHPQTHEPIPLPLRLAAFVPVNIPIVAGMLLSPPTVANAALWQWVNQTYNALFNWANANKSKDPSDEARRNETKNTLMAYGSATAVSVSLAVGLNEGLKRATLSPGMRTVLQRVVPFTAVAGAGVFNAVLMRSNELIEGIPVEDSSGRTLGKSRLAARHALTQVAISRIVLPAPVLILPPPLIALALRIPLVSKTKALKVLTEVSIISLSLWGALPAAIALFPQKMKLSVTHLEPSFHELRTEDGEPVTEVLLNKGL
ncbi:unnamed protein product [Vitrella brassicaformis CCMP3155]|uniref:Sidoreflexin n=1 Tax=Vitrella brassicaformis (strain CCMP3155) TaxID=1169540 RepID=A0A0G4EKU1_VITBC|nr:unnamed protein product [Vitrella brassicaformis CCMP3155]|eukprot:CEL97120.1 unnamed protein product [Vitrella brassicaformis CCMP3155]